MATPQLHPICPGRLKDDWYHGEVPANIKVGKGCMIDSSFCFKHYYSERPLGLRLGVNMTIWRAFLTAGKEGRNDIGDASYISNASLICNSPISIGRHVYIAGGVTITDSDFHPIDPLDRIGDTEALSLCGDRQHRPAFSVKPVTMGDDVWVGFNATILKGVSIGTGAIVAPGALVSRDVPAGVEVAGNLARPVEAGEVLR